MRKPNTGPCQRPVVKFLVGRNGLGYGRAWACGGMRELRGAVEGMEMGSGVAVSVADVLGSVGGVVDIISAPSVLVSGDDVLGGGADVMFDVAARFGKSAGGG